jgi:hypothetical protein
LRLVGTLMAKIHQGIKATVGDQIDVATLATVTAIGAPFGNVLFATEADTAITPVTGGDLDGGFVYKFHAAKCKKPRRMTRLCCGLPPGRVNR